MHSPSPTTLPLSISLSGLSRESSPPDRSRAQIHWSADLGFRAVAIDGAAPDTRARDLDRSARRDLAALLRRRELVSSGVEMWIPPDHLVQSDTVDRALTAIEDAIEFSAELASLTAGAPVLHTLLPLEISLNTLESMQSAAQREGAQIAVYSWEWRSRIAVGAGLTAGFDPRILSDAGVDPVSAAGELTGRIGGARLEIGPTGAILPGADVAGMKIALAAGGYTGFVAMDLSSATSPRLAAESTRDAWQAARRPDSAPRI